MNDMETHQNPLHVFRALLADTSLWANNQMVNDQWLVTERRHTLMAAGQLFGQIEEAAHQDKPDFARIGQLLADLNRVLVTHCRMDPADVADAVAELRVIVEAWQSGRPITEAELSGWAGSTMAMTAEWKEGRCAIADKLDSIVHVVIKRKKGQQ